jgi:hypothetical protein
MGNYKVFDGTDWLDPCFHDIYFLDQQLGWQILDPNARNINYHDGTMTAGFPTWKPITCICTCPEFSIPDPTTGKCQALQTPVFPGTPQVIKKASRNAAYNKLGVLLFKSLGDLTAPIFSLPLTYVGSVIKDSASTTVPILSTTESDLWGRDIGASNIPLGRLNNAGVWNRDDTTLVDPGEEFSFNVCFNIATSKEYICAISGDNYVKLEVALNTIGGVGPYTTIFDGTTSNQGDRCFFNLFAFPITLPSGNHVIRLTGKNFNGPVKSQAAILAEIYDIPLATFQSTLLKATNVEADINPYIYFSSKNLIGIATAPSGTLSSEYSCPVGVLDVCAGVPVCRIDVDCLENGGVPIVPPTPQIDESTEINIWFDDSGSMGSTLSPLETMQSTILQACLIQLYNNDVALYNEKVKVLSMNNTQVTGASTFEAFALCLGADRNISRTLDPSTNLVINLVFSDENTPYWYGNAGSPTWDNTVRRGEWGNDASKRYDADIVQVKTNLANAATQNYDIRGCMFRINTGPNSFQGFRSLVQATFIDEGAYTNPYNLSAEFAANIYKYRLDTVAGSTAVYYKNEIVSALNDLGINLSCP